MVQLRKHLQSPLSVAAVFSVIAAGAVLPSASFASPTCLPLGAAPSELYERGELVLSAIKSEFQRIQSSETPGTSGAELLTLAMSRVNQLANKASPDDELRHALQTWECMAKNGLGRWDTPLAGKEVIEKITVEMADFAFQLKDPSLTGPEQVPLAQESIDLMKHRVRYELTKPIIRDVLPQGSLALGHNEILDLQNKVDRAYEAMLKAFAQRLRSELASARTAEKDRHPSASTKKKRSREKPESAPAKEFRIPPHANF